MAALKKLSLHRYQKKSQMRQWSHSHRSIPPTWFIRSNYANRKRHRLNTAHKIRTAERIQIVIYKDIIGYVRVREHVRARIIEAIYPDVMKERTTIKFMLKDLKKRPVFQHFVVQWSINPKSAINDLGNMCVSVKNIGTTTFNQERAELYPRWLQIPTNNVSQADKSKIYDSNDEVAQTSVYRHFHVSRGSLLPHKDEDCRDPKHPPHSRRSSSWYNLKQFTRTED